MGWEVLIPIIATYGLPVAEALWLKATSGSDPTADDWNELRTMAAQTAKDRAIARLKAKGIDPASEEGQKLLQLVG